MSYTSPFSTQRSRRGRRSLIIATAVAVVLIGINTLSGGKVLFLVRTILTPILSITTAIESKLITPDMWATRSELQKENASLHTQLNDLMSHDILYTSLNEENETLRSLLHMASTTKSVTAHVISAPSASPYGTILIDAGSEDGVRENSAVLVSSGVVIGTINQLAAHSAQVLLVFSPQRILNVRIGNIPAKLTGRGGGNAITTIPRGVTVPIGAVVTMPELGNRVVGIVEQVHSDVTSADQQVLIGTPYSINATSIVLVTQ